MQEFKTIQPEELDQNLFQAIGKDWMLVTAKGGKDGVNTMTASWGGTGILWGKPVAFLFLRPQRYTRELVDAAHSFSLSFYPADYRKQLAFCGAKSGRDINKAEVCGFDVVTEGDTPYFAQAHTVLLCEKLYRQPLVPSGFVDPALSDIHYPEQDHHVLYVAEITKVLVKK